jgi:hypothetical protein
MLLILFATLFYLLVFQVEAFGATCLSGDADGDGVITISDAVALIEYIYGERKLPQCWQYGYADSTVWIDDSIRIVEYVQEDTTWDVESICANIQRNQWPMKKYTHTFLVSRPRVFHGDCYWDEAVTDTMRYAEWVYRENGR